MKPIYEDPYLIIVDKPSGIPVHKTLDPKRCVLETLVRNYLVENGSIDPYLGIHHRLDKDTSGCILFTKDPSINGAIAKLFQDKAIVKRYTALVSGLFDTDVKKLEDYVTIKKIKGQDRIQKVLKGGKKAITIVEGCTHLKSHSRLSLKLETGRMHQIRGQLSFRNHPILGDSWYGGVEASRLYLHCSSLELIHPISNDLIIATAAMPKEFDSPLN